MEILEIPYDDLLDMIGNMNYHIQPEEIPSDEEEFKEETA